MFLSFAEELLLLAFPILLFIVAALAACAAVFLIPTLRVRFSNMHAFLSIVSSAVCVCRSDAVCHIAVEEVLRTALNQLAT